VVQLARWDKGGGQPANNYVFLHENGNGLKQEDA
jgi:hypothetical protein